MLFFVSLIALLGIIIYIIFLFFGLSFLKAGKKMDETDYKIRENYIKNLKETGEIPVAKIKELEKENKKTLQ